MRSKLPLVLALLVLLVAAAWVRRGLGPDGPDRLTPAALEELLSMPLDPASSRPADSRPFWRALLAPPFAESSEQGTVLRLGQVLADPSTARLAAESAGELLALEVEGPEQGPALPLWRAILAGPATKPAEEPGAAPTLRLYGCRHSADPFAGPLLEDTYAARLALAGALRRHAAEEGLPLTLLGQDVPERGGVNFEVQLSGETQSLLVTFDGHSGTRFAVSRLHRPPAPNDARARASLVAALRSLASRAPELGTLSLEGLETPAANGVDLRLEVLGSRVDLRARRGERRLATHLGSAASPPSAASAAAQEP